MNDCIVKSIFEKCVTFSILISWSARDMPCFTSIQRSVSSLRTSLVTRGVAGTTSYCWKQGALFCGTIIIPQTYSYPLILYNLVYGGPFVWIGLQTFYKNYLLIHTFLLIEMSEGALKRKAVSNIMLIRLNLTSAFIYTGYGRMFCIAHKLYRQLV